MIQVFCSKRGSGKTKALITLANDKVREAKGNIVYIDDDTRAMYELHRSIRFIPTNEFELKDYESFYGFLCGILSENYDIEHVFIDGLCNIVKDSNCNMEKLFKKLDKIVKNNKVNLYITINHEVCEEIPQFIKQYA